MVRLESPNSINTYKQCPRKYFYSYKMKMPRSDSIFTIRGKAVHDALELFYKLGPMGVHQENYLREFKERLMSLFNASWAKYVPKLLKLNIEKKEIQRTYEESLPMLDNFFSFVVNQLNKRINDGENFEEAFSVIAPVTEMYLKSPTYNIQGYVDAVHHIDGEIEIIDYKTSRRDHMSPEYRRQLAIYALVYKELHGKMPSKVSLLFLRQGTHRSLNVDESLLLEAKKDCEWIHTKTVSESLDDYPRGMGPLCNWCDFYEVCFKGKDIEELRK